MGRDLADFDTTPLLNDITVLPMLAKGQGMVEEWGMKTLACRSKKPMLSVLTTQVVMGAQAKSMKKTTYHG